MSPRNLLPIALFILLLQACASPQIEEPPQLALPDFGDSSRFGARPEIPTPEALHWLTPEQADAFRSYYNHPSRANVSPHRRLYQYLENLVGHYQYQAETRTASEVLAHGGGNCLSLAILTTALAQVVNLEIGYQLMDDQPVFEYQGSVVIKGVHVSSIVYNPEWARVAGTTAALGVSMGMRIDYFPELRGRFLANIDRAGYLALYYSNIASDAIGRRDYATAYWYAVEALHHAPTSGGALNMLAVINRRAGDFETAEGLYRYGIAHAEDKLSLLKNYHALLVTRGRQAEADLIQRQLDTMDDPSPLHWLQLARESHQNGDWESAIRYYRRVLALAPYMHEVHLGLAQSYYEAGQLRSAENALSEAVTLANRVSTRNLYKAKLLTLRQEL
jgi:Tfp pilus assembly protein PilF